MAAAALSPTLSSYPGGVSKETRPWFGEQVVPQAQFAAARSDMVRGIFLRVGFWRSHAGVCTCVCSAMCGENRSCRTASSFGAARRRFIEYERTGCARAIPHNLVHQGAAQRPHDGRGTFGQGIPLGKGYLWRDTFGKGYL